MLHIVSLDLLPPSARACGVVNYSNMQTSLTSLQPLRRHLSTRSMRFMAVALALAITATACGSDAEPSAVEAAADVEAIETNDGGVRVKPPDVLEGEPAQSLPPLVEGAQNTPIVDFEYFDGTPGSTAEFFGRPTVINFWASNCAPCVAEMPEFEASYQALGGTVDFVGMNVNDTSRADAEALAAQTGVTYPLVDDSLSLVFREFGGFVMPTTVFLNPQGQVAFVWAGVLTAEELRKLIDEHIAPGSNR